LNGSSIGKEILHFNRAVAFNPWTVIEMFPAKEVKETGQGKLAVFMLFAGGEDFALIGARLQISIASYTGGRDGNIEDFWVKKYDEPYQLTEE